MLNTPLLVAVTLAFSVALVRLVFKNLSARGWGPLAAAFPLKQPVVGPQTRLRWVSVGGSGVVGHKGAVAAGASPAGLSLRMPLLAWLWHPPMLIPWSAMAPFQVEERLLWRKRYSTTVRLPGGPAVPLRFEDNDLAQAIRPWAQVEAAL